MPVAEWANMNTLWCWWLLLKNWLNWQTKMKLKVFLRNTILFVLCQANNSLYTVLLAKDAGITRSIQLSIWLWVSMCSCLLNDPALFIVKDIAFYIWRVNRWEYVSSHVTIFRTVFGDLVNLGIGIFQNCSKNSNIRAHKSHPSHAFDMKCNISKWC